MIVSYSRNFIFIKTKKTAGSTVEAVLATGCTPGDNVTAPSNKFIGMDIVNLNASLAANDQSDEEDENEKENRRRLRRSGGVYNHMTAAEARAIIDAAFWNDALKITVERHPYEKAVSQAFFRMGKARRKGMEFPEHLNHVVRYGDYVGFPRWTIEGKVAVDEFIRQENLQADLKRIGERLGMPMPAELPRFKSKKRLDRRPAHQILSDEQKEIVFTRCREEFEILGYER
jgi:hypothetical protein